jgi:hypothetical protein
LKEKVSVLEKERDLLPKNTSLGREAPAANPNEPFVQGENHDADEEMINFLE